MVTARSRRRSQRRDSSHRRPGIVLPSTFGGPDPCWTLDRLAQPGLHSTISTPRSVLSPPTRFPAQSAAPPRQQHGSIKGIRHRFPGRPAIPIRRSGADMLRLSGYSTGLRQWHELATWETSVSGPFDAGPPSGADSTVSGFLVGEPISVPRCSTTRDSFDLPDDPTTTSYRHDRQAVAWVKYPKARRPQAVLRLLARPVHAAASPRSKDTSPVKVKSTKVWTRSARRRWPPIALGRAARPKLAPSPKRSRTVCGSRTTSAALRAPGRGVMRLRGDAAHGDRRFVVSYRGTSAPSQPRCVLHAGDNGTSAEAG